MIFSASYDHNRSRSARLSPALRNSVFAVVRTFALRNLILARRKLTQLTCPRGCGRASFAEGRACSPPHPCGTVRGVRGASLAEGRARSPPARSRTDISNLPGRSPPPCRRARVREPEPDPGARGLSPPSRGTGARDHQTGAAAAPSSPNPISPRQRVPCPIEGGVAAPVWTPRPPTQHLGAGNGGSSQ